MMPCNIPRWNSTNVDQGASGMWATGRVTEITISFISVEYEIAGMIGTGSYMFPNINNLDYNPEQWGWQGYLRKIDMRSAIAVCECGAEKCKTTHARWCPKF